MNTKNSQRNEPHRFRLALADNYNLKDPKKIKMLSLHITTINLKYLLKRRMMNLIYLMDHLLFQTFKIILNTLLRCMKP